LETWMKPQLNTTWGLTKWFPYLLFWFQFLRIEAIEEQGQEEVEDHEIPHNQRWQEDCKTRFWTLWKFESDYNRQTTQNTVIIFHFTILLQWLMLQFV
jgi:hypothetical protein